MAKLNQMIAVRKGLRTRVEDAVTKIYHNFQKPVLYQGITRTYTPRDDEGDRLPPENQVVQRTVTGDLDMTRAQLVKLWDVVATIDHANKTACADLEIDGESFGSFPVPHLLFLEKQLIDLRTQIGKAPTLDPTVTWRPAAGRGDGVYATEPVTTQRTTKVVEPLVLYPATDKHPAQVQAVTRDVLAGFWETTRLSGALTERRKGDILFRINKALDAVRAATEAANSVEVEQVEYADRLLGHLLG